MPGVIMPRWYVLALLSLAAPVGWLLAAAPEDKRPNDARGIEFFEKKIRPILAEHCYQCHSAEAQAGKKLKAGLFLDSRTGLLKGGDSGPAVISGKGAESLLIKALRYDGDPRMPPRRKLPDDVIADFLTWVNMGAPYPEGVAKTEPGKARKIDIEEGRKFWAYQEPRKIALPDVKDRAWPRADLDRFILARLEAKGINPAADADRTTLVRRLYYDLIGLPPTPEEIDAFVNDRSADAYEKLVDRLLASPHFGERWGRHWLDVARYAESLTLRGFVMKEAWRYRDYVIDAFNQDLPFDQFIREQIAGDLLPAATPAERRRQLVATTILTLGNTNLEEQDKKQLEMDVVDEQLDTISRAFLAQTIGCARCHDHKFDPIPTRDYYALAGILRNARTLEHANVSKWLEVPLPVEPAEAAVLAKHESAVAALQARIKELKGQTGKTTRRSGAVAAKDLPGIVVDDTQALKVGEWKVSQATGAYVGSGYVHDLDTGKGDKTITFQPELPSAGKYEVRLAYSHASNRAASVPVTIFSADGEKTIHINQQLEPPIEGLFVSLGQYHFEKNNQGHVLIANEGTKGHVIADAVVFIPVEKLDMAKPSGDKKPAGDGALLKSLEAELKKLQETGPRRQMAMTVQEEKQLKEMQVHIRGSVHNLGEKVPRGFLQVASHGSLPALPANQSGRRELGEWLASADNPLTARVIANRTWHWLFGSGLVRTTDNFGTTGELPSHPELLDYLAIRLVEDGWSGKKLIRQIVLSHTYRQAATAPSAAMAADPENRLFGRMNRRRLDAECIRDTMLSVSGKLDLRMAGPSFAATLNSDYGYKHMDSRRSVYAPVFRNALPELFEVFDFADPSVSTGRRNVSTVAPQALFLMNHPFVLEQARHAAARLRAEKGLDDDGRITRAYRLALGRQPTEAERRIALKFVGGESKDPEKAWALFYQALFASMDFRYVN
jgi:cytochrome c553